MCWSCKLYDGRTHHSRLFSIVSELVPDSQLITSKSRWSPISLNLCSVLCPFQDTVLEPLQSSRHSRNLTKMSPESKTFYQALSRLQNCAVSSYTLNKFIISSGRYGTESLFYISSKYGMSTWRKGRRGEKKELFCPG